MHGPLNIKFLWVWSTNLIEGAYAQKGCRSITKRHNLAPFRLQTLKFWSPAERTDTVAFCDLISGKVILQINVKLYFVTIIHKSVIRLL